MTALLYEKLQDGVFIEQPEGFICDGKPNLICYLINALCGFKKCPRGWNKVFGFSFSDHSEMTRNSVDSCVYMKRKKGQAVLVALYVDDLLFAANCIKVLTETRQKLSAKFKMKDPRKSGMISGIEIFCNRPQKSLSLNQDRCIKWVL